MKRQLAWVVRGAGRTQEAFDDQGAAIRELQRQLGELQSTVGASDARAARTVDDANAFAERLDELSVQINELAERIDRIDGTVNELVRVVAPPTTI